MRKRTPGKPDKPQLEPACSRSPSDPANARLIHRGKPPAPRYSSPPCTYSRRRAFALSTIKRNFQKRKMPSKSAAFPRPPPGRRKNAAIRPLLRKTADPREQKHGHPPSWCAKKSLHEHSRFSLCPPNSAIRAPQLKDSLPPTRHLPSCARMAALPSPCRPCLRAVRALAPCFLFGIFFIYHSSIRYYPVISTQVRYKIHIHLIIKRLFPAPSSCATFQKRAVICPRSGMFLLAKHSSKPHAPFQSAQKRAVLGQERRFPNLK